MVSTKHNCDKYTITLRNKFNALQEISETLTPNSEYENFINAHMETAVECIPTKLRTKHRVPWETYIKKKREILKTISLYNKRKPTNANAQELKKVENELINACQKEQIEYIQSQNNKIRNSVEEKQSCIAQQIINDVSKRQSTTRFGLKSASQEERIHMWKENFKNLIGKSSKVTDKPITKIINKQLDIHLERFIQEVFDVVLRKIKNRKAAGLDEIPSEVWKTKKFNYFRLHYSNTVYNQNTIKWQIKRLHPLFPQGRWPWNWQELPLLPKQLRFIMLYYSNASNQKLRKFWEKIKMFFGENDSQHHRF